LTIDLVGRKALVTGGSRGIGAGIVRALAAAGAEVAFTHTGSAAGRLAAQQLVDELDGTGCRVQELAVPAEDMASMELATNKVAQAFGGLDIVVPNVGRNWDAPLHQLDLENWEAGIRLNMTSAFIAVKAAYPWLRQAERSDIVLIGSSGVTDGGGGSAFYAAAKAGLVGMMHALMRELPEQGIRINTIHPCVVDTDLLRQRYETGSKRARLAAEVPLGRLARPEDIGYLTAFLCSEMGGFICGQSILVDGGRTLWRRSRGG
jgi:3-oxoacyl-[acyl-carrier protein] reductase